MDRNSHIKIKILTNSAKPLQNPGSLTRSQLGFMHIRSNQIWAETALDQAEQAEDWILEPGSRILDRGSWIPDPGPWRQGPES